MTTDRRDRRAERAGPHALVRVRPEVPNRGEAARGRPPLASQHHRPRHIHGQRPRRAVEGKRRDGAVCEGLGPHLQGRRSARSYSERPGDLPLAPHLELDVNARRRRGRAHREALRAAVHGAANEDPAAAGAEVDVPEGCRGAAGAAVAPGLAAHLKRARGECRWEWRLCCVAPALLQYLHCPRRVWPTGRSRSRLVNSEGVRGVSDNRERRVPSCAARVGRPQLPAEVRLHPPFAVGQEDVGLAQPAECEAAAGGHGGRHDEPRRCIESKKLLRSRGITRGEHNSVCWRRRRSVACFECASSSVRSGTGLPRGVGWYVTPRPREHEGATGDARVLHRSRRCSS